MIFPYFNAIRKLKNTIKSKSGRVILGAGWIRTHWRVVILTLSPDLQPAANYDLYLAAAQLCGARYSVNQGVVGLTHEYLQTGFLRW